MAITDPPTGNPLEHPEEDATTSSEQVKLPNLRELRWPVVQALREFGRAASDIEIAEHVADAMGLTQRQRTELIPSEQETKLKNRVGWTVHELKEIDVLHYPEPGRRALTPLGMEADEERVSELRAAFEASKSSSAKEQADNRQRTAPPTAWVIRAGRQDEHRYDENIEHRIAGLGWKVPDLKSLSSRDELKDHLRLAYPDESDGTIAIWAGNLWRFRTEVRRGDLVVMPHKAKPQFALGTVTGDYAYAGDDPDCVWPHVVSVDWRQPQLPGTAIKEDLQPSLKGPLSIFQINRHDGARRFQQLLETGRDPGPQGESNGSDSDLTGLVQRFRDETGYSTDAHLEQERLREEWARKLSEENVASLSREDLLAYTTNAVDYGDYVDRGEGRRHQFILDLDDAEYEGLLDSIRDLCWGEDELSTRIDRLVDQVGGFNRDTGTKGFTGLQVSRTLAICHPDRFLPVPNHEGVWGRVHMLRKLGLPAPRGTTHGQRIVDANDRLRGHLAPHFDDDPQAIASFLYWLRRQGSPGVDEEHRDEASDLPSLVVRFRDESGYPTEAHEEQRRLQMEWAEKLSPEKIANLSHLDLTGVASHGTWYAGTYVYPHAQGVMKWIRALDGDEYTGMLDHIRYLCWSDDEPWRRYDQLTDARSSRKTTGLGHSTTSRLLAITHPQDFLAIGVQGGEWGRAAMLRRLGLPKPAGSSYGQRVMDADRRLREHLEPHFGNDTLGMGAFLGWLLVQEPPVGVRGTEDSIELDDLADELLVDVEFLDDIVELLKDKGQVILYGPPGTGKTYLARKLAEALAPDDSCRALVQFHPSTSYEDFFEGYRPSGTGSDGGIRFELTHGPLARIAERASESSEQHVMIIDEINRGNLPRVLGELLFLLEYRDEIVQTLYRPEEEPFSLPDNLWFIGTMNTADRSIALVDAALRRRFHFVPFFPDSGPMAGLLARWLKREDQPGWIGRLVDAVNDELTKELGGSHLLLGPSHFMKEYGSSADQQHQRLRRIWEYNIEPFIEDQFFGDPEQIDRFRFGSIVSRHRAIIERDRISFLADGEQLDQGAEASGSSEAQNSLERSRARGATTPAWKDQFQGTPTAPTGDDELWKWRASNFPRRTEGRGEFQIYEIRSLACRWVEFALNAGVDPGKHDSQLVEDLLSPPGYSQSSLTAYRRHLREWFETDHDSAS